MLPKGGATSSQLRSDTDSPLSQNGSYTTDPTVPLSQNGSYTTDPTVPLIIQKINQSGGEMKVNDLQGYSQFRVKVTDSSYSHIQSLATSIKHEDTVSAHLAAAPTDHQPITSHFKLAKQSANGSQAFNNNVSPKKLSHQTSYEPISPIDGDITDEGRLP